MDPGRLEGMPLFADLNGDERAEVASRVREVTVDAGDTLALQGDNAYEFFVVENGDVFGEIGVLVTGTRRATVIANTPMRLAAMFSRDFKQVEDRMPAVTTRLRELMRERVARTSL